LGSFTNHFCSKEVFAEEVLDRCSAHLKGLVKEALDDKALTPRLRLKRYLDIISGVLADAKWNPGCLIGDFSIETASQSTLLRERLEAIFQEWRGMADNSGGNDRHLVRHGNSHKATFRKIAQAVGLFVRSETAADALRKDPTRFSPANSRAAFFWLAITPPAWFKKLRSFLTLLQRIHSG
jgi:AcrR family transcriptional regulator